MTPRGDCGQATFATDSNGNVMVIAAAAVVIASVMVIYVSATSVIAIATPCVLGGL